MADINKVIDIIFNGVDDLSDTVNSISGKIDAFSTSVEAIASPFAAMADSILAVDAAITTFAVGGIVLAITSSGDFKSSLSEINTLLGLSETDLNNYSEDIRLYAQDSTQSIEQINTALYNAASLGVDYKDSLNVLSDAEKLAVATKAELNSSLETLVGTMNAYGAPMSEISEYSDAFFTIIKDGKTTLPELATSISDVTGIAAAAGIDFDTLGAAIAAMTASGAPTPQAITKIKSAIEALLSPTPAAAEAASKLGINIGEAELKSKGFPAVLQEIYDKTGGSAQAMGDIIPSIEGLQGALILGADKSGIFAKALEDMSNKTGATTKAFEEMANNLNLVWQNVVNNWESMLLSLGEKLDNNSSSLLTSFGEVFSSIASGVDDGTFDPIIELIDNFIGKAGELINGIADNLPAVFDNIDFSGLVEALQEISESIGSLFENIDLSTPEGLQEAVQNVVDTLSSLANVTSGMIDSFKPFIDGIANAVLSFNDLDTSSQQSAGNILGIAKIIVDAGLEIGVAILAVSEYADKLAPAFELIINGISFMFDSIKISWNGVLLTFAGLIEGLLEKSLLLTDIPGFTALKDDVEANIKSISSWKSQLEQNIIDASFTANEHGGKIVNALFDTGSAADESKGKIQTYSESFNGIPSDKQSNIELTTNVEEIADIQNIVNDFAKDYKANIGITTSGTEEIETVLESVDSIKDLSEIEIKTAVEYQQLVNFKSLFNDTLKNTGINITTDVDDTKFQQFKNELLNSGQLTELEVSIIEDATSIQDLESKINKITGDKKVSIKAEPDFEGATQEIEVWTEHHGTITIEVPVDSSGIDKAKDSVEKIPTEKQVEIKLQGEIDKDLANIEARSNEIQTAMEWQAKLDIAEAEASAEKFKSMMEGLSDSIGSMSSSVSDMFGSLTEAFSDDNMSQFEKWSLQDYFEEQQVAQNKLIEAQVKLAESETNLADKKAEAIEKGDMTITVDAAGIEPELEAFLWAFIKKVQIKGNELAADFLLGI